ncbi:hypothetical protein L208DRAFT_177388 [Tricholoma matsutake]|nr:hypothetical protein L208DRAFT_177388 [Tricholoma matsutake 945]
MPIQLPPQPAGISLPAHPHNPPTLADTVAKSYKTRVDVAFDDAARADVCRTNIITAHSALVMTAIMAPFQVMLAQTQNHLCHDGSFTPFTIVPFNDGSMPTQAPLGAIRVIPSYKEYNSALHSKSRRLSVIYASNK